MIILKHLMLQLGLANRFGPLNHIIFNKNYQMLLCQAYFINSTRGGMGLPILIKRVHILLEVRNKFNSFKTVY